MAPIFPDRLYLIQPQHIRTDEPLGDTFGDYRKDFSAHVIVLYCQKMGYWAPFTLEELRQFYREIHQTSFKKKPEEDFSLSGLDDGKLIVRAGGLYALTHKFVASCFKSSPANRGSAQDSG